MKKRLLSLLLAGMLLIGTLLSGCGEENAGTSENASVASDAESAQTENDNVAGQDGTEESGQSGNAEEISDTESDTEQEAYVLMFSGTTLDGETMTSECFADAKLTMINVWATFCGPCINEMPELGEIAKEYDAAEFQLIGIISDVIEGDEGDTFAEAKEIIAETGADYKHLLLNEELYRNLVGASDSVPTTYFFNEKGELLGYLVGAQSKEVWMQIIDSLLAELE